MIKANELRRGNWLMGRMPVQVDQILSENTVGLEGGGNPYFVYADPPYQPCLKPIPLTTEILKKLGFKASNSGYYKTYKNNPMRLSLRTFNYNVSSSHKVALKYVHQLQNLYFALTGEELEFSGALKELES